MACRPDRASNDKKTRDINVIQWMQKGSASALPFFEQLKPRPNYHAWAEAHLKTNRATDNSTNLSTSAPSDPRDPTMQ